MSVIYVFYNITAILKLLSKNIHSANT